MHIYSVICYSCYINGLIPETKVLEEVYLKILSLKHYTAQRNIPLRA